MKKLRLIKLMSAFDKSTKTIIIHTDWDNIKGIINEVKDFVSKSKDDSHGIRLSSASTDSRPTVYVGETTVLFSKI